MKEMRRRDFLKGGLATLVVGTQLPWLLSACGSGGGGSTPSSGGGASAGPVAVQELDFHITDGIKDMVTHNSVNTAQCYYWCYYDARFPADCPGPQIFTTEGDKVKITLTNELDEEHAFSVSKGGPNPSYVFASGPIAPGETKTFEFTAPKGGTYLYYDNLNEPVNRTMGLHGAFIVMPRSSLTDVHSSPYSNPTPAVKRLFDDFGVAPWWPGLAWGQGDPATDTPAFRQHIWLTHQASPRLFAEVGNYPAGLDYPAATFVNKFQNDLFRVDAQLSYKPSYFTLSGQAGYFSHNNPYITPMNRVGEPVVIRILNAGLILHSMHIHANHIYVTSINGVVQENPLWVDVFNIHPLDTVEYVTPYMRPPDVPNQRGIGRADAPLAVNPAPIPAPWGPGGGATPGGVSTWPPVQEYNMFIPNVGYTGNTVPPIDLSVRLSPLCFPMHDHSEASQTAGGGNYNCGLIAGINFTGDRNAPGGVVTFPRAPTIHGPEETGPPTVPFGD